MTNEHNFKKGDIVVFNGEHLHISEEIIKDDVLTVYDVSQDGDKVWVKHPAVGKVDASELEMYLPFDCKTAFLTRLQSLLREFDAEIGDSGITRIEGVEITFGDNTPCIRYKHCTLNADNIMDFDKE